MIGTLSLHIAWPMPTTDLINDIENCCLSFFNQLPMSPNSTSFKKTTIINAVKAENRKIGIPGT